MSFVIVLICISTGSIQSVMRREYSSRNGANIHFNLLQSLVSLSVFMIIGLIRGLNFPSSPRMYLYSLAFAAAYVTTIAATQSALSCGPFGLSSLIMSYSPILPTCYGLIFLGDPLKVTNALGILCFIVSIWLVRTKNAMNGKEEKNVNPRWLLLVVTALVNNGFCAIIQKAEQNALGTDYSDEFMICALAMVSVGLGTATLCQKNVKIQRSTVVYPIISGAANGITNMLVMVSISFSAVSVFFPMISAGQLLASLMYAVFLYKEKLNRRTCSAAILGLAAIVLLKL